MAKSKVGGSRAYIRGRIGADVYSIGKDGKGTRQQVVRSLAEQVSNPRTESQMFGRMIMSTVMQAVSTLQPIIDHSFDGLPKGQPCISEFIRENYSRIKEDAIAHPASGNTFGLNKYQEKGMKMGAYLISKGNLQIAKSGAFVSGGWSLGLDEVGTKVSDLATAMGVGLGGYNTLVWYDVNQGLLYARVKLNEDADLTATVSAENISSILTVESNYDATASFASGDVVVTIPEGSDHFARAIVISDKINGVWCHNTARLAVTGDKDFASDVALPTYPTGTQQFLNGGDL